MRHTLSLCSVVVIGLGSFGFFSTGCQSQKDRAGDRLAEQSLTFQKQLDQMPAEIDAAIQRLQAATSGQNPRRADDFREYTKQVEALKARARVVGSEADRAEIDGAKYFTAWAKAAKNAPVADKAAVREAAAVKKENYDAALGYLSKARADFRNLVSDLDAVTNQLKGNLTEQGILDAQPMVGRATSKALDVRNMIDRLDDSINAALANR